ncbi:MAG: hypothetical protein A2846_01475 [Candidatus Doudnabacteria bacterium RIFCSPHIGHO2_01_FULL_49_9]|uniref:Uncharacterized protein n=1 Tax=Candidatus Doudnabacteria bacterium RIFCSPHIGHO2_01_FULL_49_9 TaxID=1817827 RepID=A0A1F5NZA7_9BACT|nr:MAG: hypothetical protein A2846_01475 [Candidatus Doudnabacteria bacterium RIFCSPHIGHO2_01_FULL_49_9]
MNESGKEKSFLEKGRDEQYRDFADAVINALPRDIDSDIMGGWIEDPAGLSRRLGAALGAHRSGIAGKHLKSWHLFYHDLFQIDLDFGQMRVPDARKGFDRLIVVASGLTPHRIFEVFRELFGHDCYGELAGVLLEDERSSGSGPYAVWAMDNTEPDDDLKGVSAESLKNDGVESMTLVERLLFGLKYHNETGDHLDRETWTLCAGSRHAGVFVPRVGAGSGIELGWCSKHEAHPVLRARRVVA